MIQTVGYALPPLAIASQYLEGGEACHAQSDEHRHEEGVGNGGGHVPPPTRHAPQSGHRDQCRQVGEYPPRQQRPPGLPHGRHREYARALQHRNLARTSPVLL